MNKDVYNLTIFPGTFVAGYARVEEKTWRVISW